MCGAVAGRRHLPSSVASGDVLPQASPIEVSMSFRRCSLLAVVATSCLPAAASAQDQKPLNTGTPGLFVMSARARIDNIARAALFEPRDIAQLDTRAGRQFEQKYKNLPLDATVECYYKQESQGGATDKFHCVGPKDPGDSSTRLPVIVTDAAGQPVDVRLDEIKVRYASVKVFSSVITTRLEWALGFGSDVETPVTKVICHGCSNDPFAQSGPVDETHEFPRPGDRPQVTVEQRLEGTGIYMTGMRFSHDNGEDSPAWRWDELDSITDPVRRAQADALKLFAAFIQHVDNKALQNVLLCRSNLDRAGVCQNPFLYIHDLGNTLGTANGVLGIIHTMHPLDLSEWKNGSVWKDEAKCVASLQMISGNGPGLTDPSISEAGRRLLADRLTMLINARNSDGSSKLRDIFDVAHIEKYDDHGSHFTADDWVSVFIMRARQITEKKDRCP
jgi:hypothetical protein